MIDALRRMGDEVAIVSEIGNNTKNYGIISGARLVYVYHKPKCSDIYY